MGNKNMGNKPTAKTIQKYLKVTPDVAKKARAIIDGTLDPRAESLQADRYAAACYNPPGALTLKLYALNEILCGYGAEYIASSDDGFTDACGLEYVNMGDPYAATVFYDRGRGRWYVGSWGDVVERFLSRFQS